MTAPSCNFEASVCISNGALKSGYPNNTYRPIIHLVASNTFGACLLSGVRNVGALPWERLTLLFNLKILESIEFLFEREFIW